MTKRDGPVPEPPEHTRWGVDVSVSTFRVEDDPVEADFKMSGLPLPLPDYARVREISEAVRELVSRIQDVDIANIAVTRVEPFCEMPYTDPRGTFYGQQLAAMLIAGLTEEECELRWDWNW